MTDAAAGQATLGSRIGRVNVGFLAYLLAAVVFGWGAFSPRAPAGEMPVATVLWLFGAAVLAIWSAGALIVVLVRGRSKRNAVIGLAAAALAAALSGPLGASVAALGAMMPFGR